MAPGMSRSDCPGEVQGVETCSRPLVSHAIAIFLACETNALMTKILIKTLLRGNLTMFPGILHFVCN